MNDSRDTPRDDALRRMLVGTVDATPPAPPLWRRAVLPLTAFALAGALTACTFAVFGTGQGGARPASSPVPLETPLEMPLIVEDDVVLFGAAYTGQIRESTSIGLAEPPAGANGLAIAAECLDFGSYEALLDAEFAGGVACTEEPDGSGLGGGGGIVLFADRAPRVLTLEVESGEFAVWAVWVYQPPDAEPSAAQQEALADGVVTRAEYVAGFDQYVACMADLGFEVTPVGMPDAEILGYVIPGDAGDSGAANRCYEEHFQLVDREWQIAHAD